MMSQKHWRRSTTLEPVHNTMRLAYAWGREEGDVREKGTGYLDDWVILNVGNDDQDGLYAKVKASELLRCSRICPGRM